MSVMRLLLSGLLVASGLILGAFTLHGYLDPQWPQRQMQAAGKRGPTVTPWSTKTVQSGERVVAPRAARQKPSAAGVKAAARARKRRAEKRLAEERARKAETAKQQPQQATLQWPWNWLTN